MRNRRFITAGAAGLCIGFCAAAAIAVPGPAHALDFKKLGKNIKRDFKQAGKNTRALMKDKNVRRLATGVGAALIVGGAIDGNAVPIIAGVALIAAPEIFKTEMRTTYASDWAWSGCISCYRPRIVVAPGRKVTKRQADAFTGYVKEDVKDIQRALAALDLYNRGIDGDFGPGTRAGVKAYQASLGARQTGHLTANQRYSLFAAAASAGVAREADVLVLYNDIDGDDLEMEIANPATGPEIVPAPDVSIANPEPESAAATDPSPETVPAIPEYRLAASQLDAFSKDFVMNGDLTAVKSASLQPDGLIDLEIEESAGSSKTTKLTASPGDIVIGQHPLSAKWVRISVNTGGTETLLNTVDVFTSDEEAARWIADGKDRLALLTKLTETGPATASGELANAGTAGDEILPQPTSTQVLDQRASGGGKMTELALADAAQVEAIVSPAAASPVNGGECRKALYVSLNFPEGTDKISHYNIIPPANTLMFDNGDSTLHFTGPCVNGSYEFKYVAVENEGKKWRHTEHKGSFLVAGNAEQCDISLNDPSGSARLLCF